ncbi:ribonuclease P protein component 4 [Methanobrevibacter curvatus]|uniref:Ribonuclease P protein component 4 n=1 Tax=Methanobrevibacter curvatus TaxID=49547 RepID=A0A166B699_9EURY|nr:ribonuclease P protein component 4 [Methanobrevibacter curvatus]
MVVLSRGKKPKWMLNIAIERMNILFNLAEKEYHKNPLRSHRYVYLARKISKKYNIKIPENWNRRYCKKCYKFLQYGKNSSVRLIDSKVHIHCYECGNTMKIPYIKEKKLKRRAKIGKYSQQKRLNESSSLKYRN